MNAVSPTRSTRTLSLFFCWQNAGVAMANVRETERSAERSDFSDFNNGPPCDSVRGRTKLRRLPQTDRTRQKRTLPKVVDFDFAPRHLAKVFNYNDLSVTVPGSQFPVPRKNRFHGRHTLAGTHFHFWPIRFSFRTSSNIACVTSMMVVAGGM